ncbi:unnamed protein product [marine sediment metagenome]|uniref:Bbp19-like phage domain-containing protein n=1 Tax=marine sediment metagenome TaxID=412755 RepID=X0VPP1_9ZZZZ
MNEPVRKLKAQDMIRNKIQAYQRCFTQPDGEFVMEDLYQKFNGTTLKHKDGVIDPYASIAAGGCREVLLYIEQLMRVNDALD